MELVLHLNPGPKKYERDNLSKFVEDLTQFIRDQRKKYGISINYLLIPELHADGRNWHMHGLFSDLPIQDIEPHNVTKLLDQGYVNWSSYEKKFGYNSLGAIRDSVACTLYITKYISKAVKSTPVGVNKKLYYCSRGLKTAPKVAQGLLIKPINFDMAFKGLYSQSLFVDSIEWFNDYFQEYEETENEK
ncbi:MAG: rolling circle replication-associated protein [Bacteroidales bacterium]